MQSRHRPDASQRLAAGASPGAAIDPDVNNAYPETEAYPESEAYSEVAAATELPAASARDTRTARVTRLGAAAELVIGVWLAVSPWLIGSGGSSVLRWNDLAIGAALAGLALPRLVRPGTPRTPIVSFGLGAWTIVAAFVLSFQNGSTGTAPLWNAIFCGAVLTAAAAWSTTETERAALRKG